MLHNSRRVGMLLMVIMLEFPVPSNILHLCCEEFLPAVHTLRLWYLTVLHGGAGSSLLITPVLLFNNVLISRRVLVLVLVLQEELDSLRRQLQETRDGYQQLQQQQQVG
jgi:hypothetical protein